jgi:glycosyltransferase involved in cell wall biosynthesis
MEYFCDQILPRIRASMPEVTMTWVGRASENVRREYWRRHAVHITGYVDDVRPYVHGAACSVAPLRVGGGTRLKILDAWALGAPLVSTSLGCEGLAASDGKNLLVRDTADGFALAVCEVLRNPSLRASLGAGGRETAVAEYDWKVIGDRMLPEYRALLPSSLR